MNSLLNSIGSLPGYFVYFAAMFLTAAQLAVLLKVLRIKQSRVQTIAALLHFFLSFFILAVLLNYTYNALIEERPEVIYAFELELLSLPWLLYVVLECISAAVILLYLKIFRQYRNTQLTAESIRQTVDLLPTGLLISDPEDGTVLLANLVMTKFCRKLNGELLHDAGRFWQSIESSASENVASEDTRNLLVHTPEEEIWQFTKSRITLDGSEYDQMTATNITGQYCITKELSDMNHHLKEVQFHMRSVAAKERSLVASREVMNARMTVHNRMGAVLLSGKYYLDHPENVKEEELLHLLEYNNHFLLGQAEQPEKKADPLQEAIKTAARIGVRTEISGDLPENETARRLIAQAIDQCAANTVRHAGGDRLQIRITETETLVSAEFANNGKAPDGPVTETGGLAVLRKEAEKAGGTMVIKSKPAFLLTLSISK